jgi:hypothetical protein
MKRILSAIAAFVAFFAATCYAQTAPIGVCVSNVALTISNGFTAPVPFALVTLCSAGSTQTTCTANMQPIFTSTALSTPTPNNPFKSDVGGNYFFCAPVGHYALMISGSQGIYFVNDIALVDDWSKGGTVTGTWSASSLVIPPFASSSGNCAQFGSGGQVVPTTFPCGNSDATGTVTNVAIGPGWPSWFTPNVTNPTTTPSLNMTVGPIPNSALQNASIVISGTTCTLGSSCTLGTSRTCNSNGCYSIGPDGTIHQSWKGTLTASGQNTTTSSVSWPIACPTQLESVPSINSNGIVDPGGDPGTPPAIQWSSLSTAGGSVIAGKVVVAGAGGGNFNVSIPIGGMFDCF